MGHGIANAFALHGYTVNLYEDFEPIRNAVLTTIRSELEFMAAENYIGKAQIESTISNIKLHDNLEAAVIDADYVIEATPESLDLKRSLFEQLDASCPAYTILASNTSSLPLSEITISLSEARKARTMVCSGFTGRHRQGVKIWPGFSICYHRNA